MSDWQTMPSAREDWQHRWQYISQEHGGSVHPLQLYVLLDLAQSPSFGSLLPADGVQPLFGFARSSKEGQASPWLVHLGSAGAAMGKVQQRLLDHVLDIVQNQASAMLLVAGCGQEAVLAHLRRAMDVQLQGRDAMYLALWDPAVLAALMGQADVATGSHIEPVLLPVQLKPLMGPVARWICWSRAGHLVEYGHTPSGNETAALPLRLSPAQVEAMVQANVPDLLIYHLRLNQPQLWEKLPQLALHWLVRQQVVFARRYGLKGTRDLLNYLCLALIAGARFDALGDVAPVLAQVRAGRLRFDEAMDAIAEKLDEKQLRAPQVLTGPQGLPLTESQLPA